MGAGFSMIGAVVLGLFGSVLVPTLDSEPLGPGEIFQSEKEAIEHDLSMVASARGWTFGQAQSNYHAAEVVGAIAEQVAAISPDIFVGSSVADSPGDPPTIFVKGPATSMVVSLVKAADIEVIIADGQPFSFQELEERKLRVLTALQSLGFDMVTAGFRLADQGRINASVTVEAGLPDNEEAVRLSLPADLRDWVSLSVSATPVVETSNSFGGMWVLDDGVNTCTSGFSVINGSGATGVMSAGHCSGINGILHPGIGNHTLSFVNGHRGQWGDVEWYTSNVAEPDDFYAANAVVRDVAAVEARANISENEPVCGYGRSSNAPDCSLEVLDVSEACIDPGGIVLDRLVVMNGATSVPGDSGGPWYLGTRAYGSFMGTCGGLDAWSVADLFDEAMGVAVRR